MKSSPFVHCSREHLTQSVVTNCDRLIATKRLPPGTTNPVLYTYSRFMTTNKVFYYCIYICEEFNVRIMHQVFIAK